MANDRMVQEMIETAFRNLNETEKKQLMEKLGYVHEVTAWDLGTMLKHLREHYNMMAFGIPPEDSGSEKVTWGIDNETAEYFLQCVDVAFAEDEYDWGDFNDLLHGRDMVSRSEEDQRNEEIVELMLKYPDEHQGASNKVREVEKLLNKAFVELNTGKMGYTGNSPSAYAYRLFFDLHRKRAYEKITEFYKEHIQGR